MIPALKAEKETVSQRVKKASRTVKTGLKHHYVKRMPDKKGHRVLVWALFLATSTVIGLQLAYPLDRGLPFAGVPGHLLGFSTHNEMARVITEKFDTSKIKLTIEGGKEVEYSLKSAGAEPNTEVMIAKMSDYPFWQRFIPGSILWQPVWLSHLDVYYAGKPLQEFVMARDKELSFAFKNARLAIKDGALEAVNEADGRKVKTDELTQRISSAAMLIGRTTVIPVPAAAIKPERTARDLAKVRTQAEAALAHSVSIRISDKEFVPKKAELASWIVLSTNDKGDVSLTVDKDKIKAYLAELNKTVGSPAGQTDITIVDGREVGRTTGHMGKAIDTEGVSSQIASGLMAESKAVVVNTALVDIHPGVIFNSRYTATQAGLQAYVEDVARQRNMRIVIRQLDGERWYAHARETESIPSASTFKLFLAMILFDKMDKGEIHWDDPMLDTTVAGCFERMTVASTNPCAESWIAQWGRQYINDFIYDRGFSGGTTFISNWAVQTTAADLNKFMTGLNDGTLVSGAYRERLLNSLGRHPYRYGIPTGSAGVVHDKVGFLWDFVHDTAIVQHPRGTYIMTVMTRGQSYGAIASVTREVERIMYP